VRLARAEQQGGDLAVGGVGGGEPLGLAEAEALGRLPPAVARGGLRGQLHGESVLDERARGRIDDVGEAPARGPQVGLVGAGRARLLGGEPAELALPGRLGRRGGRGWLRRTRRGPGGGGARAGVRRHGRVVAVDGPAQQRVPEVLGLAQRRPEVLAGLGVLGDVRTGAVHRHAAVAPVPQAHLVRHGALHDRDQAVAARVDDAHAAGAPVLLAAGAHVGRKAVVRSAGMDTEAGTERASYAARPAGGERESPGGAFYVARGTARAAAFR
jgi:hypothetical protein